MIDRILKFGTKSCQPCKLMDANLQEYAIQSGIPVQFIDAEEETDLVADFGVRNVPTTFFLDDGEIIGKKVGLMTVPQIEEYINDLNSYDKEV